MKPIEVGCMALVIGGNFPQAIGKSVKVLALISEGELVNINIPGEGTKIKESRVDQWLVTADNLFNNEVAERIIKITTKNGITGKCAFTSSELIRIDGEPEEELDKEREHV